jgi:hypothetical protein
MTLALALALRRRAAARDILHDLRSRAQEPGDSREVRKGRVEESGGTLTAAQRHGEGGRTHILRYEFLFRRVAVSL